MVREGKFEYVATMLLGPVSGNHIEIKINQLLPLGLTGSPVSAAA